jgi:hypothetical protein
LRDQNRALIGLVADLKAENRRLAKRLDKAAAERWKKDAK